jgi:hypothetical protein
MKPTNQVRTPLYDLYQTLPKRDNDHIGTLHAKKSRSGGVSIYESKATEGTGFQAMISKKSPFAKAALANSHLIQLIGDAAHKLHLNDFEGETDLVHDVMGALLDVDREDNGKPLRELVERDVARETAEVAARALQESGKS